MQMTLVILLFIQTNPVIVAANLHVNRLSRIIGDIISRFSREYFIRRSYDRRDQMRASIFDSGGRLSSRCVTRSSMGVARSVCRYNPNFL